MWGAKPLAVILILSMLSACAGRQVPDGVALGDEQVESTGPESYAEAVEARTSGVSDPEGHLLERSALAAAHRADERRYDRDRRDHYRDDHYHDEPTPGQRAAAEAALLVTGSIFVCTFVVVVLNGACEFGAHAGYYY